MPPAARLRPAIPIRILVPAVWLGAAVAPAVTQAQDFPTGRFGARGVVMSVQADGRYAFTRDGQLMIGGAYGRTGADTVELRDDSGPAACRGALGRYTWRRTGDTLRFAVVADSCAGRRGALPGVPWVRRRDALALRGATLIDGTGAPPRPGVTLILRDGRIAAVHADGAEPLPDDAEVRDLAGAFVTPGLIDAHVHLATSPSGTDRRDRVERRLRNTLLGGVVAVRDMAGDGRALADLARAAAAGDITSPEIRYAALIAGPAFFDDPRVRTSAAGVPAGTAPWARSVTDTTDLRQAVAEARGTGATALKLYAELDARLTARIVQEAHRQGLPVWSHLVLVPARPGEVVSAGVDVVSHALFALWEVAELPNFRERAQADLTVGADHPRVRRLFTLMRERNVILDATLFVYRADSAAPDTSVARRREARAVEFVRAAHAAGVRIAAGTDGMIRDEDGALPNIHTEMQLLVQRVGLTPMEALIAATRTAAQAAGIEATHGTIAVGKAADLLVLSADPTADIRNTREIRMVVRRGSLVER